MRALIWRVHRQQAAWLSLAMLTAACSSALSPNGGPVPVPVTRFSHDDRPFSSFSGISAPTRLVVRDTTTWRSTWQLINQPFIPQPPLPTIDFSREMVLLAGLGTEPSGGYELRIERATRDTSGIDVQLRRTTPAAGCPVTASLTQPIDLVRVPFSEQPVRFSETTQVTACDAR